MKHSQVVDLVILAQEGDRNALGELINEFHSTVYSIAMRRLRNREDALEITQEIFIRVMRKLHQLSEPKKFAGWVRQIAVRTSINRALRRNPEYLNDPEDFDRVNGTIPDPESLTLKREQGDAIRSSMMQMKELDRDTLVAFYFKGQSIIEMGEIFRSPLGTIKRRLHTARSRLKEIMENS